MSISLSQVHVYADDADAALAFYRDALGLSIGFEVENEGFRYITLVPEAQPDVKLILFHPRAGRSPEDGDAIAALLAKGELGSIHLRSDDLEATFTKIAETPGAEIVQEPADQPWGVRDGAVRDPAGNLVRIEQG